MLPDRERTWFRLLIAEDWDIGGRFRKFLSLLINGRNLLVLFGETMPVQSAMSETRGMPRGPRRMWRQLRVQFRHQRAATIGPDLSHRRTIVTEVLRTQAVRDAVRQDVRDKKLSRRDALKVARGYAYEVAANYSHAFVVFASGLLGRLWNRLYDGVELANFSSLQSVDEGSEIVYVPCHRSHMDYLLLSYVVYHKGYAVPHIAAGINLNMPVIGSLLRRGGAFFLRRSFGGNATYSAVFSPLPRRDDGARSLDRILHRGRPQSHRAPDAAKDRHAGDDRARLRAQSGASGRVRADLLRLRTPRRGPHLHRRAVRTPEGKGIGPWHAAHAAGAAQPLRQGLREFRRAICRSTACSSGTCPAGTGSSASTEEKPAWLSPLCVDLAHQVMTRINAAACVTPVNLMGTVLLATPRQRMGEADLARQLELYASLLRQAPYSPRVWVTPLDGQSMIRHCDSLRMLYRQPHPLGDIVGMTEATAVLSSYYRNNVLHLLLMPSLLASAFLNNASVRRVDLLRLAGRVYPYVADEYFLHWRESDLPAVVDELLEDLLNHGLLTASDDRSEFRRPAAESSEAVQLSVLARISVPILERYYLAISLLLRAGSGRLTQEALEQQCQLTAQRMAMLYELNSPEFFDRALFGNFVERLRARNVVSVAAEDRLVFDAVVLEAVASDAQFVLHEQIRNSILQVVHR